MPHPDGDIFEPGPYESRFVSAQDGVRLHLRDYGARHSDMTPVICLPGLARTAADFHELATALGTEISPRRRVIALDYRGRGRSGHDSAANYLPSVEVSDLSAVITALELPPAVLVGTSRGGILTMLLAAIRPGAIAGAVLNDIGPQIEPKGLVRIKGYVGKLPMPRSFEEGADILRRLGDAQFPKLTAEDWLRQARRTWMRKDGRFALAYDPNLAKTLQNYDLERPLPPMWPQFEALASVPVMVIRGANSDILSAATVDAMRARRLDLEVIDVPDEGHAPLLVEPDIVRRIAGFVTICELTGRH